MTTEEHLNRIVAKCRELLAIAEKRTTGPWSAAHTPNHCSGNESLYEIQFGYSGECVSELTHGLDDAAFIASCAGPAEAGWRATIAAIESARLLISEGGPEGNSRNFILTQIIAAWPEELL